MDDGNIDAFKATQINTDSFSLNDIHLLQIALMDKIKLRTRLYKKQNKNTKHKNNKRSGQLVIVIPIRKRNILAFIVGPYMHPSIEYKVKGLF